MGLKTSGVNAGTCKQPLKFVPSSVNTCLIPAPPPPTGPKGIPTPMPITTDTSKIADKPVPKVKHKGGKVPNTDSIFPGIKGNNAGIGDLPPGMPKKDVLTMVIESKAFAIAGCPNCEVGGKSFLMTGSPGMGNCK